MKIYSWLLWLLMVALVGCGTTTTTTPKLVQPTGTVVYPVTNTPYKTPTLIPTMMARHTPTPLYPTQAPLGSCQAHNGLPDATCTPGDSFLTRTPIVICAAGYARSVRNVTQEERNQVFAEYGVRNRMAGQWEVDHLVPLELGGTNDIKNLWPESAGPIPGFHQKDELENVMHSLMCSGKLHLTQAQHEIESDWITAYKRYVLNATMP